MLVILFILLFSVRHSLADSYGSESSEMVGATITPCPGICIDASENCDQLLDGAYCGNSFYCCLDEVEGLTEATTEVDEYEPLDGEELTTVELQSEAYTGDEFAGSPEIEFSQPETEAEIKLPTCPGACIPNKVTEYCEFIIPDERICSRGTTCCVTKKQAEELTKAENYEPQTGEHLARIPKNENVDKNHCPATCLPREITCNNVLHDYLCPQFSVCCEDGSTASRNYELLNCTGSCLPNQVLWLCQPPRELVRLSTCQSGSTCCDHTAKISNQNIGFTMESSDEETASSDSVSVQNQHEILSRLVRGDRGQVYQVSPNGQVAPLPLLTSGNSALARYKRVSEIEDDGYKVVILVDSNGNLYQKYSLPEDLSFRSFGQENLDDVLEEQPFGMPNDEELRETVDESPQEVESESSLPDSTADIENNLKEVIIPEEGDEPAVTESIELSPEERTTTRPRCPGSCISYYLRFTCRGNVVVYDSFSCPGKTVCCTTAESIDEQEKYVKSLSPFAQNTGPSKACDVKIHSNGENLSSGNWCWQVAVINTMHQYLCGGVIIDNSWVLTAAHCVSDAVREGQPLLVRAGVRDLTSEDNKNAQTKRVLSTFIHHNHNSVSLDNDVALLRLQNPFEVNSKVCIACLPSRGMPPAGKKCIVTGYGFPSEEGGMSLKTGSAEVSLVDDLDCMANITNAISIAYFLPASSFCAGNGSSCQGDAGGPLVCEKDGFYELFGVLSWSLECGSKDVPSVYAKISSETGWINQIVANVPKQ